MINLYNIEAERIDKMLPQTDNSPVIFDHTNTYIRVQAKDLDEAIKSAHSYLGTEFKIIRVSEDGSSCSTCRTYRGRPE